MEGGVKVNKGFVLLLQVKETSENPFNVAYRTLFQQGLFHDLETFWFAWREEEIRLPGTLEDIALATDRSWDVIRIFSSRAELRRQKRGKEDQILLLLENEARISQLEKALAGLKISHVSSFPFCLEGRRILAGTKMEIGVTKEDGVVKHTTRGVVAFPRELDYKGIKAEPEEAIVADVHQYFDDEKKLRYVRYCRIHSVVIPQRSEEIAETGVRTYEEIWRARSGEAL